MRDRDTRTAPEAGHGVVLAGQLDVLAATAGEHDQVLAGRHPAVVGGLGMPGGGVGGTLWGYGNILSTLPHFPAVAHFAWLGAGIAAVPASQLILNRARRHLAPVLSSASDLADGSYVLYLRPFSIDDDRAAVRSADVEISVGADSLFEVLLATGSDEQQIATTLRPAGTVVAVGAPGESLPYKGALRMYLAQDWQPTVARLIRNARLVVVTLASSEGTMWELAEAMRTMPPQRLLLMVPPMERNEYEAIRARNAEELHGPVRNPTWNGQRVPALPDSDEAVSGPSGLIRFSEQWQPTFVRLPRRDPVSSGYGWSLSYDLRRGLRPAFDVLSLYERSTATRSGNAQTIVEPFLTHARCAVMTAQDACR